MREKISKFYLSTYVAPNGPDLSPFDSVCSVMQQQVCRPLFMNAFELKKRLVKSGAEQYQHCYQRMDNACACLCSRGSAETHLVRWEDR